MTHSEDDGFDTGVAYDMVADPIDVTSFDAIMYFLMHSPSAFNAQVCGRPLRGYIAEDAGILIRRLHGEDWSAYRCISSSLSYIGPVWISGERSAFHRDAMLCVISKED